MKVFLRILLLLSLVVYLVFAVTKLNDPVDTQTCSAVNVVVEDSAKAAFITSQEIRDILTKAKKYPEGEKLSSIDCLAMEQVLLKNPFIDKATCFKTAGGQVIIKVQQRLPVMRVINTQGENYFIDSYGKIMPHMHYTADMVVATGHISRNYAQRYLVPIGKLLQKDSFWDGQIEQIHVNDSGCIEMIPRVGEHVIKAGKPSNFQQKLQRLKTFYEKVLCRVGWNKYSSINIEYDNQIICKK